MSNFKTKLFGLAMDHPKMVMAIVGIITLGFLFQIPKINVDTDPENMLESTERVRVFHKEVKERFNLNDMLVLGVFSEKGIFKKESIERIVAITEEIKELDGVLVDDMLALTEVDDISNEDGTIRVHPLLEKIPETAAEGLELKFAIESNPILSNKLASLDGKLMGIYIPIAEKSLSYTLSQQIEEIAVRHLVKEQYYIAGLPVAQDTFGAEMFKQMGIAAPLAGLVIGLLLFFFFRNFKIVLAPMLLAIISIIWTMGLLIGMGYTVHIMSSMIPIFLFPIAVLNSIHILSSYHERYQKYKHLRTTIQHTMDELFAPMLFTSLTTTAGFASLAMTPIPPVKVFGLFVSFGIFTSWLLSMTFLPAYSMMLSKKTLKNFGISEDGDTSLMARALPVVQRWSSSRSRGIIVVTVVLLAISAIGISKIVVNDNPVNWFKKNHPLRLASENMNNHMGGTYMSNLVFEGEEDSFKDPEVVQYVANLQQFIYEQDRVGATSSITDVIKKIAVELKGVNEIPDSQDEIAQYYFIYEMSGGDPDDLFTFITDDYSSAHIWIQMNTGDSIPMKNMLKSVERYMNENPLPVGITAEWAGMNYINVFWQEKMVKGMIWSLLGSFVIVFIMMIALFRSFIWGLLSMVPLTVTITFIYALIGYFGLPYDMPVAVLSSLTLGLSIDFAIHFIKRAQHIHTQTGDFAETMKQMFEEPAKAIARNMLVIAVGFVPLLAADLVPYITVGSFFLVIMLFSGVATLFILPAFSTLLKGKLFPAENSSIERNKEMNKLSKKAVITALVLASTLFGGSINADAQDSAEEIMKESHLAYYYAADDGVANVEMTITNKKGKERKREFVMLRKDIVEGGEQRYFTYFKKPTDVSRMTFMVWKFQDKDDSRWIFIPSIDLVKAIAAKDRNSSFVGSDFSYEDVSGRHWSEDIHTLEGEAEVNGHTVIIIKSVPKDPKTADYAHRISYLSKENKLPIKEEYVDKKGTVVKQFDAEVIETIEGIPTITIRKMMNLKKNNSTIVKFSKITYNAGLENKLFTERYLRKPPRKFIK